MAAALQQQQQQHQQHPQQLAEQFARRSFLNLGKVLSDGEVAAHAAAFDRDRRQHGERWRTIGRETHQTGNTHTLSTWPEVDALVRHPRILPTVRALMGGPLSVLEVSARHMARHPGAPPVAQQWHRDTPHNASHPLRLEYVQLMVFLTDVTPRTHCFAIRPESVSEIDGAEFGGWWQAPQPPAPAALRRIEPPDGFRDEAVEVHGRAGTAILFSASALHAGTIRADGGERKTVQVYFCHRERALGGDLDLKIPEALLRDTEARLLYGPQAQAQAQASSGPRL